MTTTSRALAAVVRADHVPGPPQGSWTYDDYAAIPADGNRYEIIDGVLYMAAAPNLRHQAVTGTMTTHLKIEVEWKGTGRVFSAPVDVLLPHKTDMVQPDVVVVLRENYGILTREKIIGAPDLVIEVASPSTSTYDRREKMTAYAHGGVREYWLVDPYADTVELLYLEGAEYHSAGVFSGAITLPSPVLPDLPVHVEQFFT